MSERAQQILRAGAALLAQSLVCCSTVQNSLIPHSPQAEGIVDLWWILFWGTLIPTLGFLYWLLAALLWPRNRTRSQDVRSESSKSILLVGGLIPLVVVVGFLFATFSIGERVAARSEQPDLTVDIVGHMFWWEVIYPDHNIHSANELHVPANRTVRLRLTAADVIHSFWVPALHGKLDMVPGTINELWLNPTTPGTYRGQCAEFCGVQHALMAFWVVVHPPDEYESWLQAQARIVEPPTDPLAARGLEVYYDAECAHCHRIAGLTPSTVVGTVGPDLTNIASRLTLAAGVLSNNRGNLAGWLLDPQTIKPGNRMPPSVMNPQDLHALLYFLETLR